MRLRASARGVSATTIKTAVAVNKDRPASVGGLPANYESRDHVHTGPGDRGDVPDGRSSGTATRDDGPRNPSADSGQVDVGVGWDEPDDAWTARERKAFRIGALAAGAIFIDATACARCRARAENLRIAIAAHGVECEPPEFWPQRGAP